MTLTLRTLGVLVLTLAASLVALPAGAAPVAEIVSVTSERDFPYPQAASKKGLQVEMTDDAEELGVQHAGINVAFNEIMRIDAGTDPAQVIPFESGGRTFYFDAAAVAQLDGQIKPLSDNNVLVNLILILYQDADPTSAWPVLHHPDAEVGSGIVYAFNTKTDEGIAFFTAAMEFLADRYTRTDQQHGRAVGYIVGNEVDAQWVWANAGDMPLEEFIVYYARAVRIAWQATQKYWSGARTYISLTHCWTTVCGANPDPANPTRFYPGKSVIDQLNALTKETGDFGWNIAHHPYPENLGNPAFWNDQTAQPGFDTPRITFKNLEVLPAYLAQPDLGYEGASRRIILSEQGCNTPSDTEEAQRLQAACYAFAYYKIRFLDSIDAFILHRHVDHKHEGGLRLGVWSWDDGRPDDPALPGDRKVSYDVFRYIDTARSLEVTDFAKEVIGIDDWADEIAGFDPAALDQRRLPAQAGVRYTTRASGGVALGTFDSGSDGWRLSDNAASVARVSGGSFRGAGHLRVRFDANLPSWSTVAKTWKGTDVVLDSPIDAGTNSQLALALRVPSQPAGLFPRATALYAQVRVYAADGRGAYGIARLSADGRWTPVAVDLSGWAGRAEIARVKVWVRAASNVDWKGGFDLDDVRLVSAVRPDPVRSNLDVGLSGLKPAKVGSKVALTLTNNDAVGRSGELELRACDGVAVSPSRLSYVLQPGASSTSELTLTAYAPADADRPVLCVTAGRTSLDAPIVLRDPPPRSPDAVLFDFDDGTTQGWQAGTNVSGTSAVTSFANGPGSPFHGTHALDAASPPLPPSSERTVFVEPSSPLDLSAASSFTLRFNCYGAVPSAIFHARVRLFAGTDMVETTGPVEANRWNEVLVDVADWAGRSAVTKIEVTFWSTGWEHPPGWDPHFQLDYAGYYTS